MGKGLKTSQDARGCAQGEHIDTDVSTPDGLAVDWVHQLLFWTDTGLDQVREIYCCFSVHNLQLVFAVSLRECSDNPLISLFADKCSGFSNA